PHAPDVLEDLEAVFEQYPTAVVQLELIQAVGGVRSFPLRVLHYLQENKRRWGYLLFVDEVQTGMYRTGPFIRSSKVGVSLDLLALGKGTSDMMFPFALTLYSQAVQQRPDAVGSDLPQSICDRYGYEMGYKSVLGTLQRASAGELSGRVEEMGRLF